MPNQAPDHTTDIELLKYKQQVMTEALTSLSVDVREMKDALLLNIASNKGLDTRHADYDARLEKLTQQIEKMAEQTAEHQAFINKVVGVLRIVSWMGLPTVAGFLVWVAQR